jgi:hypothetical protein
MKNFFSSFLSFSFLYIAELSLLVAPRNSSFIFYQLSSPSKRDKILVHLTHLLLSSSSKISWPEPHWPMCPSLNHPLQLEGFRALARHANSATMTGINSTWTTWTQSGDGCFGKGKIWLLVPEGIPECWDFSIYKLKFIKISGVPTMLMIGILVRTIRLGYKQGLR